MRLDVEPRWAARVVVGREVARVQGAARARVAIGSRSAAIAVARNLVVRLDAVQRVQRDVVARGPPPSAARDRLGRVVVGRVVPAINLAVQVAPRNAVGVIIIRIAALQNPLLRLDQEGLPVRGLAKLNAVRGRLDGTGERDHQPVGRVAAQRGRARGEPVRERVVVPDLLRQAGVRGGCDNGSVGELAADRDGRACDGGRGAGDAAAALEEQVGLADVRADVEFAGVAARGELILVANDPGGNAAYSTRQRIRLARLVALHRLAGRAAPLAVCAAREIQRSAVLFDGHPVAAGALDGARVLVHPAAAGVVGPALVHRTLLRGTREASDLGREVAAASRGAGPPHAVQVTLPGADCLGRVVEDVPVLVDRVAGRVGVRSRGAEVLAGGAVRDVARVAVDGRRNRVGHPRNVPRHSTHGHRVPIPAALVALLVVRSHEGSQHFVGALAAGGDAKAQAVVGNIDFSHVLGVVPLPVAAPGDLGALLDGRRERHRRAALGSHLLAAGHEAERLPRHARVGGAAVRLFLRDAVLAQQGRALLAVLVVLGGQQVRGFRDAEERAVGFRLGGSLLAVGLGGRSIIAASDGAGDAGRQRGLLAGHLAAARLPVQAELGHHEPCIPLRDEARVRQELRLELIGQPGVNTGLQGGAALVAGVPVDAAARGGVCGAGEQLRRRKVGRGHLGRHGRVHGHQGAGDQEDQQRDEAADAGANKRPARALQRPGRRARHGCRAA